MHVNNFKSASLFFYLLFCGFVAKGQTKEQSLLFLNRFYQNLPGIYNDPGDTIHSIYNDAGFTINYCSSYSKSCEERKDFIADWENIKFIGLEHIEFKETRLSTQLACWHIKIEYSKEGKKAVFNLYVNPGKEKVYCDRLVKAMIHMAELQGAKLDHVSENLFDN